jgi:hypothetical protein
MEEFEAAVALRLRAVMDRFQITTHPQLAKICGTSKSCVNNWLGGKNLPRVPEMIRLCEQTGITLDWLYCGVIHSMDAKVAIHLGSFRDPKTTE